MSTKKASQKAGGFDSVKSTFKHILNSHKAAANMKNLLNVNQTKGFDCPGCAWGDKKDGLFQFCENGAKAIAWESTDKQVTAEFFAKYSVSQLAKQSDYWLEYQGRLAQPMRYNKATDHYQAISWQQAYQIIATKLGQLTHPDQVEFYTSGRASNEVSYLYQLFGRSFGTNNFPDCSNMCHEASGVALNQVIGVGKGTVVLDDFEQADAIFVFGQNPGTNHPRMMNALRQAARRGCQIVSFNNLKEVALKKFASPQDPLELLTPKATTISHAYFSPKLGGDMAAIRGIVKHLLAEHKDLLAWDFIKQQTSQFDEYIAQVEQTSWQKIETQSGLSQAELKQAAQIMAQSKRVICTWAMGITQHKHSVDTIKEIVNLQLLTGNIGKAGAGLCPVRGHSNVQGNRTMGINEQPSADFIHRLNQHFNLSIPTTAGHNVQFALKALAQKQSKVLICLGGNIAAAAPDTQFTYQALKSSELNVQISTKLNRSHLMVGDDALILPCLGRTEVDMQKSGAQFITVEDTFSMVHASQGTTEVSLPNCQSEIAIIANIAEATLGKQPVDWLKLAGNYDLIRDLIAQTIDGFEDFNQKVKSPGGFHLTNSAALLKWKTHNQKANFSPTQLPDSIFPAALEVKMAQQKTQVFTLQSLRSHDQYNTTIYGMDDRYRGVFNQRNVLFIHPQDAKKLKLAEGDTVKITSIWADNINRSVEGFKLVFYDIPKGNLAAYYPETNPLVAIDSVGDDSHTPTSKSIAVILTKMENQIILK